MCVTDPSKNPVVPESKIPKKKENFKKKRKEKVSIYEYRFDLMIRAFFVIFVNL